MNNICNYNILDLLFPSLSIFVIGFFIVYKIIKDYKISFIVSFLKSAIFFIYFSYLFNGYYTFLDDIKYYKLSQEYMNSFDLVDFLKNPESIMCFIGGKHVLYYLYNIIAFKLFGNFYFSPVALNIILTYIIAIYIYKILFLLDFNYKNYFIIFYLLNWDILSWSEILNLKDFLVQFLTVFIIYHIIEFFEIKNYKNLLFILISLFLLHFIRFYLVYLVLFSTILFYIYINKKFFLEFIIQHKIVSILLVIGISTIVIIGIHNELLLFLSKLDNPIIGIIRFILTPLPFNIKEQYSFLLFASWIDFLLFPFLIYGIYKFLSLDSKYKNFIFIYVSLIVIFYGCFSELQGVRHKIQILPFLFLFQFIGIIEFVKYMKQRIKKGKFE